MFASTAWSDIGVLGGLLLFALVGWEVLRLLGLLENRNLPVHVGRVSSALAGGAALSMVIHFFVANADRRWPAWFGLVLACGGGHWIAGERMRDGSADAQAALSRPGRYQTVRDNLRVKDVRLGDGDKAKRFVVCHNPAEAERDKSERDAHVAGSTPSSRGSKRSGARRRRPRPARRTRAPSAHCATTNETVSRRFVQ